MGSCSGRSVARYRSALDLPPAEAPEFGFEERWLGDSSHLSLCGIYERPTVPDEGHRISQRLVLHELLSTQ